MEKLNREKISQEDNSYTLAVEKKPARPVFDPLRKLIGRPPGDNAMAVNLD